MKKDENCTKNLVASNNNPQLQSKDSKTFKQF